MKGNIFIKRPVMAISISVLILVIGLISLFTLPVEQYPDIAPPTVYVSANYTGADAEAVLNSVIMPLEESINGVENMMYISSTATNAGSATIQVYFKQGTDPDMAAVNVQNCVSKAQGLLPAEVTKIGVTTQKRQTSFLQIGALVSTDGRYDQTFLANYLDINVIPQIKRIEGVGDVMELGDTYSMRIWLDLILKKEIHQVIDWSKVDKEDYLLAMERSPIRDIEIKHVLNQALTDEINSREIYMKGIDTSYYYEGYVTYKTEEL